MTGKRMGKWARAAAVGLVAGALAVAGCGGDTEANNAYVDAVNKAQTDFADSVGNLQGAASNPGQVFDQLRQGIRQIVADLEAVEPPEDVATLHGELIDRFSELERAVADAEKAVESGRPQEILDAQSEFADRVSRTGAEATETINEINRRLQE